jgi:cytoskeletal protein RodZ
MSPESTVVIAVGVGVFLILAGVALLVLNRLPTGAARAGASSSRGSLTEAVLIIAGAACLIAAVAVNSNSGAPEPAAPTGASASSVSSASAPSSGAASEPAPSPTSSTASPPASKSDELVSVTSPKTGGQIEQCQVFTGTSTLTQGETIVLSVSNVSDPTKTLYLAPVHNWQAPGALAHWSGTQYFGSGDSSVGQTFHVDVVIMEVSQVKQALAFPSNVPTWATAALPSGSILKSELTFHRVSGAGSCP